MLFLVEVILVDGNGILHPRGEYCGSINVNLQLYLCAMYYNNNNNNNNNNSHQIAIINQHIRTVNIK